jgi:hypothetical protein
MSLKPPTPFCSFYFFFTKTDILIVLFLNRGVMDDQCLCYGRFFSGKSVLTTPLVRNPN